MAMLIIFAIAFAIINIVVSAKINRNNQDTITSELALIKTNCEVYVRQSFMLNALNNEEASFQKMANQTVRELLSITNTPVGAYGLNGVLISTTNRELFADETAADVSEAVASKTAYYLNTVGGQVYAYYSFPVIVEGVPVGILRFIKDYSPLFGQGREMSLSIMLTTVIVFAVMYLLIIIVVGSVTGPIVRLSRVSQMVADDIANSRLSSIQLKRQMPLNRKDEIGRLANNFFKMVSKLNFQVRTIKQDRDSIQSMYDHRKEFFDSVTHELKTPLTSIRGYAQMIVDGGYEDKAFLNKGMGHIIKESDRLKDMVVKLLEMSDNQNYQDVPYELLELGGQLKDTCEAMQFKGTRYGFTIRAIVDEHLTVSANPSRLREVWINLIDNAIKYGEPGTEIIVLGTLRGGKVCVDVRNRGKGIAADEADKIFEPFYRLDKKRSRELGSAGLGLALCQKIVAEHKGEIRVDSVPQKETTFTVVLPQAAPGV
ncbi:MAG: HAMP domain-containing sensor histidine kinase [Eubacteriales bacterium]|nr:HAMP domain-containing sensor histidine kinase [Eubacteriales bacterium]